MTRKEWDEFIVSLEKGVVEDLKNPRKPSYWLFGKNVLAMYHYLGYEGFKRFCQIYEVVTNSEGMEYFQQIEDINSNWTVTCKGDTAYLTKIR